MSLYGYPQQMADTVYQVDTNCYTQAIRGTTKPLLFISIKTPNIKIQNYQDKFGPLKGFGGSFGR